MLEATKPPAGSRISIVSDGADRVISIAYPRKSGVHYVSIAFILAWLGGWAVGEYRAITSLMARPSESGFLMVFLLCGWTLLGAAAGYGVWRLLRKSVPETIRLEADGISYDTGLAPARVIRPDPDSDEAWSFPARKTGTIDRRQLTSLRLLEGTACNRLTVDDGAVDLATAATDGEREWLFKLISQHYR